MKNQQKRPERDLNPRHGSSTTLHNNQLELGKAMTVPYARPGYTIRALYEIYGVLFL